MWFGKTKKEAPLSFHHQREFAHHIGTTDFGNRLREQTVRAQTYYKTYLYACQIVAWSHQRRQAAARRCAVASRELNAATQHFQRYFQAFIHAKQIFFNARAGLLGAGATHAALENMTQESFVGAGAKANDAQKALHETQAAMQKLSEETQQLDEDARAEQEKAVQLATDEMTIKAESSNAEAQWLDTTRATERVVGVLPTMKQPVACA